MASNRTSSGLVAAGLYTTVSGFVPNKAPTYSKMAPSISMVEVTEHVGISRSHWVPKASRPVCKARSCRLTFSLINTPRNCYRCGEVFCRQCLKQSRRLNLFANYDPQGKFYKVCKLCFDSEQQGTGATRSMMKEFRQLRSAFRNLDPKIHSENYLAIAEQRIKEGFISELNSTPSLVRLVQSLTITLVKGAWKKPVRANENQAACKICKQKFEMLFKSRHHCSICGDVVCDSCSNRDLIVYVADSNRSGESFRLSEAIVNIIKVSGGPAKEPEIHQYLRICKSCYEVKKNSQLQRERDIILKVQQMEVTAFWDKLSSFHDTLLTNQRQIASSLEKYEVLVKSLEDGSHRTDRGNNVQTLSKAQIDLSDLFVSYLTKTNKFKALKPVSSNTQKLASNIQMSAVKFYSENRALYKELRTSLEEYLPHSIMETIQSQVNKNALICVHLLVKQLALEVISFDNTACGKQAGEIAQHLVDAEQVITDELQAVLHKLEGDDMSWEEHERDANLMIRELLREQRLISVTPYQRSQPEFLLNLVVERSCEVLDKISLQLKAKVTQSSYTQVKDSIQQVKESILELVCRNASE